MPQHGIKDYHSITGLMSICLLSHRLYQGYVDEKGVLIKPDPFISRSVYSRHMPEGAQNTLISRSSQSRHHITSVQTEEQHNNILGSKLVKSIQGCLWKCVYFYVFYCRMLHFLHFAST